MSEESKAGAAAQLVASHKNPVLR